MDLKLIGRLNRSNQQLIGSLNVYTMETGDGRDIELAIVDEYICWRRVNDIRWIQLAPLSELKGEAPLKGIDYWTEGDKEEILNYVESCIGDDIPHSNILGRDEPDQHPISSITGLDEKLNTILSDKTYIHKQPSSASVWDISHNLNKYPSITVIDSAGTIMIGEVHYIDLNNVKIEFSSPFSGKAYFN